MDRLQARVVTLSGTPGSGKTTVGELLAEQLGLEFVSAGHLFRNEAGSHDMSLAEFGKYCESHPEIDQGLDARQVERLREGNVVLEGRLAGWMAHRNGIAAVKVWLDADESERTRRVNSREQAGASETLDDIRERQNSERLRYRTHHGIDLDDLSIYDVIVDTTDNPPERVAEKIMKIIERL